jgi:hypothetical protein
MKTPCQVTGGFTEKTLLVKNLLVLSFHYPINILHNRDYCTVSWDKYQDKPETSKNSGKYNSSFRRPG